ncbi:aminodeoxychorismate synthase component I [bacterium]|nr:aminodeoxychorismate synthase component I [bacterium]
MYALIFDPELGGIVEFKNPIKTFQADNCQQVLPCLEDVESQVKSYGGYAVGYVAYEASPAFDSVLTVHKTGRHPLLVFGIFEGFRPFSINEHERQDYQFDKWQPNISKETYRDAIATIKHHIAEGDTYQVNYTFVLRSLFKGDTRTLFLDIQDALQAEYAAYLEMENNIICSFSPELFFSLKKDRLVSKPMKGTAKRGLTIAQDNQNIRELSLCKKNRAENIMIVDMIRNDMGRVAETGTVTVESRFDVEKHPYVLQMTSTVSSRVNTSLTAIFRSLFPCASITGAPKVRTMEIINRLEREPRGVYTGCIGYYDTEGTARFNVAIRTIRIEKPAGLAEYAVGSGIVWDSNTDSEYEECLMKADFLSQKPQPFKLFESLLWEADTGYFLLEEHLKRLSDSADYFGFVFSRQQVLSRLKASENEMPPEGAKVKILMNRKGTIEIEIGTLDGVKTNDLRVGLAREPVNSQNRFLYHKTTIRDVYEQARQSKPDCDDVILWNEREEVTESCRANVVADINGELLTPPVICGLLGGTFREQLIREKIIKEKVITIDDLKKATRIYTINSVRRWMTASLIEG